MEASSVAREIKKLFGHIATSVEEGEHDHDGTVNLSEEVHIQVPTYGRLMCVHRFDGEAFHHFPFRTAVKDLKDDIAKALADAAEAGPIVEKPHMFDVLRNGEVIDSFEAQSHAVAQAQVDAKYSPKTCLVSFHGSNEMQRGRAIKESQDLTKAEAALRSKFADWTDNTAPQLPNLP